MANRAKSNIYVLGVILLLCHIVTSKTLPVTKEEQKMSRSLFRRNSEPPDLITTVENILNNFEDNGYSEMNAPVAFECQGRQPLHVLKNSIRGQGTRSPYIITVNPSVIRAGNIVTVSIETIGGHTFRGMILQAIPTEGKRTGAVTGGRFLSTAATHLQSCYTQDDTVTLGDHAPLNRLELQWVSSAQMAGDFVIIGSFVEDSETFWTDVKSTIFTINTQSGNQHSIVGGKILGGTVNENSDHVQDVTVDTTQHQLNNGVMTADKLDVDEEPLHDIDRIFGDDVKVESKPNNVDTGMKNVPEDFVPPQSAEFISKLLGAMGGGGSGGGGLGSMFNMMSGLGPMASLLGKKKSPAVAPPPVGLPPRVNARNEPSLMNILGVDPATVVDAAPAAAPAKSGGKGIGSLLGNIGTLTSLASLMKGSGSKQQPTPAPFGGGMFGGAQQSPFGGGMFSGAQQPQFGGGMFGAPQQPPASMQTLMQQLQMQQMQITALQGQLGQGSVTNNMMGGFGNSALRPSTTFGQQNGMFGQGQSTFGQVQPTFGQGQSTFGQGQSTFGQGQSTFGQGQSTFGQTSGGFVPNNNQFSNNFGQTAQQFPNNGRQTSNTNNFGQSQMNTGQNGQDPLLQELIRQNQLLMQQNQHLRTGPSPPNVGVGQGQMGGFGGQTNNINNGMPNQGQNFNNGMMNSGQNFNNNNQGFSGNNGIGQNTGNVGQNNNLGQNSGIINNAGLNGASSFGQNPNSNSGNTGSFGQNQNINNNPVNSGTNVGQNGIGQNSNFNNQNIDHNTNNNNLAGHGTTNIGTTPGTGMGQFGQSSNTIDHNSNNVGQNGNNFGQNSNNVGQNGNNFGQNSNNFGQNGNNFGQNSNNLGQNSNNLGQNTNNFGQNSNTMGNNGFNGVNNNGQNSNMNQNTGNLNNGNNFGMPGSNGFNNQNNGNSFGGLNNGNPGGPGVGSSGQSPLGGGGGLASMFGGAPGNNQANTNPLGGLLGNFGNGGGGAGGGAGAGDLSSLLGNFDPSALQGMLGGGGGGGPDIASLMSGIDPNAIQGMMQGEEGSSLMNSMNQLMSSDTGGSLMQAMQGMMSGDASAMGSIESILSGKDGQSLRALADQAQGMMSNSGLDTNELLGSLMGK